MSILLMTLLAAVFVIGAGVLALLVLLLVGIRTEERHMSLTRQAPHLRRLAGPRLTGASVRRPQHCRYEDTRR